MDNEMKDLAARMAADEANKGNYAAAAELTDFAEGRSYVGSDGLLYRGDPDAPTGPLTPGQVPCRVCQLDDRTRAATDPDDLLCTVCRANAPIREEKARRREATVEVPMSEVPGHAYVAPDHCAKTDPMCPKPMAPGSMYCDEHRTAARQHILRTVVSRYFDTVHGKLDDTTAEGSAAQDLRAEQIDTAMRLIDLAGGHPLPYSLVNAAELGTEKAPAEDTRYVVAAVKNQRVLQLWDGDLFDRPDDHVAQSDLQDARERAHFDASPWNVCALIPVPDETVFGDKQPEDPR